MPVIKFLLTNKYFWFALIITGLIVSVQFYHKNNEILKANQATLEHAISEQTKVILSIQSDVSQIKSINKEIKELEVSNRVEIDNLINTFNKNNRDFTKLVKSKPNLVIPLMNQGTSDALECLNIISEGNIKC